MENQKNSGDKDRTALGRIVTAGLAVGAFVTFLCNSTGVINNLIGIGSFVHAKPATVTATPHAHVNASPTKPEANKVGRSGGAAKPVTQITQISGGNNSPNVNRVQGSVRYQAGPQDTPTSLASPDKRAARAIKPSTAAVTQFSAGDGSPNISNVGGDVDIRYPAPAKEDN